MSPTLLVIVGPTGIGKTSVAVDVANHFGTEVVSADSRQIYKEMSIGTAAPTLEETRSVPHHFIQVRSIHDPPYSAYDFEQEALMLLKEVFSRHTVAVLTGGSMLYIDALLQGIDEMPSVDEKVRARLKDQLKKDGLISLQNQLKECDLVAYNTIDLKNPIRVIHALEVYQTSGKKYSSFLTQQPKKRDFRILLIGLKMERSLLYKKINYRVELMMKSGLEEEARALYQTGDVPALRTVGYQELFEYFRGNIDKTNAIELIKRNSRRYAKKQLTWLKKKREVCWFEHDRRSEIIPYIEKKLDS